MRCATWGQSSLSAHSQLGGSGISPGCVPGTCEPILTSVSCNPHPWNLPKPCLAPIPRVDLVQLGKDTLLCLVGPAWGCRCTQDLSQVWGQMPRQVGISRLLGNCLHVGELVPCSGVSRCLALLTGLPLGRTLLPKGHILGGVFCSPSFEAQRVVFLGSKMVSPGKSQDSPEPPVRGQWDGTGLWSLLQLGGKGTAGVAAGGGMAPAPVLLTRMQGLCVLVGADHTPR